MDCFWHLQYPSMLIHNIYLHIFCRCISNRHFAYVTGFVCMVHVRIVIATLVPSFPSIPLFDRMDRMM